MSEIKAHVLRTPLADKFIRKAGSPILTSGEIRPTNIVPVIAPNGKGQDAAFPMKWGFMLPQNILIVNSRVETAATKPTFKESWERHRCIIPASWYYEWKHMTDQNGKDVVGDKYMFQPRNSTMTYLAGLYRMEDGLPYFAVLTREATKELKVIHDRMPVVLPKDVIHDWISPGSRPEKVLPYAITDMVMEKVAR